jgi:hypothetical protein
LKATVVGDSRLDLSLPSGNRAEIRNHSALPISQPTGVPAGSTLELQATGAWSGPDGVLHGMANHNVMTDAAWFFPAATLTNALSSQGYLLSYVGQETYEGQPLIHVQISQPIPVNANAPQHSAKLTQHLTEEDLYVDPITLFPLVLGFTIHPDGNALSDIPMEIHFSDYRVVNGVQVPFHVQRYLNKGLALELQFDTAMLNSGISETAFELK